jgi:predicted O-linked N-acetylglucosamine transferase (SPINDLY family)
LGYVSQDLRAHSIRHFVRPLLANHDPTKVETFAYNAAAEPDGETAKLRPLFAQWRDVARLDDAALAEAIRADGIDVLVDLAGHTAGSRLKVFALRPAPVQVTWLGYGGTTGIPAIDWYLGDARMLPPGAEAGLVEGAWRLRRPCFAYDPPAGMPDPGPLPARRRGHVTFASFSRLVRVNDGVVAAWSAILNRVPGARLFLNALPFADHGAQARMRARFAAHGISADRLELRYTRPQPKTWAAYRDVDIALDPFVHNGGVTSFEALWMGVPIVGLRARPPLGRYGDCLTGALAMEEWCVDDVEAYVARAVASVSDPEALAATRASLRARMARSELCDGAGLARALEAAYAGMRESVSAGSSSGSA